MRYLSMILLDRLAAMLAIWALRRLYGGHPAIGLRSQLPADLAADPTATGIGYDVARVIADVQGFFSSKEPADVSVHHHLANSSDSASFHDNTTTHTPIPTSTPTPTHTGTQDGSQIDPIGGP